MADQDSAGPDEARATDHAAPPFADEPSGDAKPVGTGEVIHTIRTVPGADDRIELVDAPDLDAGSEDAADENVEGAQMQAVHDRSS